MIKYLIGLKSRNSQLYGKIDHSADDNWAFCRASENGHLEVVKYLISLKEAFPKIYGKIDPSADNNYSFSSAAEEGHLKVLKYLIFLKEKSRFFMVTLILLLTKI